MTLSGSPQAIMKLTLSNNAYEAELMLREAQLQGSAINSFEGAYGGVGIFFNRATSSSVLKYRDRVDPLILRTIGIGDGVYKEAPIDEKESIFRLSKNNRVGKLCVAMGTSGFSCNDENLPPINAIIRTLDVSFTRPKQAAHIYINGATTTDYTSACIQFDSLESSNSGSVRSGYVRSVIVYRSGMIAKKAGTCN